MHKTLSLCALLFVGLGGVSAPVQAGPVTPHSGGLTPDVIRAAHIQSIRALWNDAQKQRQMDGGTLTPEHLAKFQRRLDRSNDDYRRKLANYNPLTVDADGHINKVSPTVDWTWSDLARVGTEG